MQTAERRDRAELRRLIELDRRRDAARLRTTQAYYLPADYAYGYAAPRTIVRQVPVYRVRPNVQYVPVDTYPVTSAYLPYPEELGGGLFGGGMGGILGALLPIMLEQMVGGGGGGLGGLGGLLGGSGGFAGDSLDFANPGGASFAGLGPSLCRPLCGEQCRLWL